MRQGVDFLSILAKKGTSVLLGTGPSCIALGSLFNAISYLQVLSQSA